MRNYTVTIKKQFPPWDEVNGITYEVSATSKREAVEMVRRRAINDGHVGCGQGRYTITAVAQTP